MEKLKHNNMKYLNYLKYLLKHKWYVMIECFKYKLFWRGLVHDISKFYPSEFIPYSNYFNEWIKRNNNNEINYYNPTNTDDELYNFAAFRHQKRNKHHWQWWISPQNEGGVKILEILEPYRTEMLCDWIGAGKAQGRFSPKNDCLYETRKWWDANKDKMQLHENTRKYFEDILNN
jgi:hypothetical protein